MFRMTGRVSARLTTFIRLGLLMLALPWHARVMAQAPPYITEFALPTADSRPHGITAGPDGNVWFTGTGKILRITPTGTITEFPLLRPNGGSSSPFGIAAGPDGNLWFTELTFNRIGRITPDGTITQFPLPAGFTYSEGIAAGPDGNIWFTSNFLTILRITPSGTITVFGTGAWAIAAGPDGNLWFTDRGSKVGRITPAGAVTEFLLPTENGFSHGITAGSDGNV
jgi:virginiamycin B lyase